MNYKLFWRQLLISSLIAIVIVWIFITTAPRMPVGFLNYGQIRPQLRSGDLIVFGERSVWDLAVVRAGARCEAVHVGVVILRGNRRLFLQGFHRGDGDDEVVSDGIVLSDLDDIMSKRGSRKYAWLAINRSPSDEDLETALRGLGQWHFNSNMGLWVRDWLLLREPSGSGLYCSQIIAQFLHLAGITEPPHLACHTPCALLRRRMKLRGDYAYDNPVYFRA